jgi:predicted RNA-binding protein YlxR (DUF448 family)
LADLIRLVLVDGEVVIDENRSMSGRGAHAHRTCLGLAIERKAFNRAFHSQVSTSLLNEVISQSNDLSTTRANNGA